MTASAYDRRIFQPAGPGSLRCLLCGVRLSSNAWARASHERGKAHLAAAAARVSP